MKKIQVCLPKLERFGRNERGLVLFATAMAAIPVAISAGGAIDLARTYMAQSQLTTAADAAALAGAGAFYQSNRQQIARDYFDANYPADYLGTTVNTPSINVDDATGVVTVNASATVPTTMLQLASIDHLPISAEAVAQAAIGTVEVAMVLDNTGSMSGTKISTLRDAANELVDILLPENDLSAQEKVRIGLVPFTTTVKVNRSEWMKSPETEREEELADALYNGCAHMRSGKKGWNDKVPTGANKKLPFYDAEPANKAYDYGCNSDLVPLTNNRTTLKDAITGMVAEGHTSITLGTAWGWRVLSPKWRGLWTEADHPYDYDEEDHQKFLIILTDGAHVSLNNVDFLTADEMDKRLEKQCTKIKEKGMTIYSIMFQAPSSVRTMFQNCATDSSKFIESTNNGELRNAFKRIAGEIRSVYLSK
ncbi:MAG: pilus assembly protein TadG-related protein [Geminicoccaceae bacterium]